MAWDKADYAKWAREWRKKNQDKVAYQNWKGNLRRYGLTPDEYEALEAKQRGCCAVCNKPQRSKKSKRLYVDHCHKTGRVRGLLCGNCNTMLGLAKEREETLVAAISYLRENAA